MAYKEVTETTVTYPDLDEQDKQDLRDNPKSFRVFIVKEVTEEFVVQAYNQEEAEDIAKNKAESYSKPDGSEVEDVSVSSSELDRCTYASDEIEYIEEEILDVT